LSGYTDFALRCSWFSPGVFATTARSAPNCLTRYLPHGVTACAFPLNVFRPLSSLVPLRRL